MTSIDRVGNGDLTSTLPCCASEVSTATTCLHRLVDGALGDVSDAVIVTDLHFGIRRWNAAAERLYGWSEDEVRGRPVLDVLYGISDSEKIAEVWESLERTGRWHDETTQVTRNGSVVEILSSTTLISDEAGDPVGIVSVNRTAVDARSSLTREQDSALAARLSQALADDEFVVHYQPVVDLVDGRLITLEALVRWEHPERGTLAPGEFLDTAERSGLIVELGEQVLDKACRQIVEWRRSGTDVRLSVNVSTRQLTAPGMVEQFTRIMHDAGLDPKYLWLEVTETALVEEMETASDALRQLVDLGVGVSIDDFGTGWASLTYLRSFPVHALKIDRSFVSRAGHTAHDTAIVRSILSLGAELDLFVVAEGIETEAQHDELKKLGCVFGQGYLFGRPVPASEVPIERAARIAGEAPEPNDAPAPATDAEGVESDAIATLLRGLLRVRSAPAVADLVHSTIREMGGTLIPADEASEHALPVDVSLGEGPPVLVEVDRFTIARMHLERLLPRLIEDARQAVDLLRETERLMAGSDRDALTGFATCHALNRVLPRTTSGTVVMIALDHLDDVNDRHGHKAGDAVLMSFAKVLTDQVRHQDMACRIGGEEFALVLTDAGITDAVAFVDRVRAAWSATAPREMMVSAGVAEVGPDGGVAAMLTACRDLHETKGSGRDQTDQSVYRRASSS